MLTTISLIAIGLLALFGVILIFKISFKLMKIFSVLAFLLIIGLVAAYFFYLRL